MVLMQLQEDLILHCWNLAPKWSSIHNRGADYCRHNYHTEVVLTWWQKWLRTVAVTHWITVLKQKLKKSVLCRCFLLVFTDSFSHRTQTVVSFPRCSVKGLKSTGQGVWHPLQRRSGTSSSTKEWDVHFSHRAGCPLLPRSVASSSAKECDVQFHRGVGRPLLPRSATSTSAKEWDAQFSQGVGRPVLPRSATSSSAKERDVHFSQGLWRPLQPVFTARLG